MNHGVHASVSCLRSALCLAALAAPVGYAAAATCPAPVCVDAVEVDGKPATEARDITLRSPDDGRDRKVAITAGTPLADGTVVETPARPRVRLRLLTRNGNAITLQPGSRLRIESVGDRGERYTHLLGEARFAVAKALSFFEVAHDRFLAAVKGTEFGVTIDDRETEIRFDWVRGEVLVEHEVVVAIAEQDGDDDNDDSDDEEADGPVLIEREVLSESRRELRYRLGPREYLKEFRTFRDAEQYFRDQLAQDEQSGNPKRVQAGLTGLGSILVALGRPKAALPVLERALALAAGAKNEAEEVVLARRLGLAYRELKDYSKATEMFQRVLAIEQRRSAAGPSLGLARAYTVLGRTAGYAGDARGRVAALEKAVAMHRQLDPGETQFSTAAGYKNLADAYWAAGQRDEALRYYRNALALKQKLRPDGVHGSLANSLRDLGQRHLQMGDTASAIRYFQQALDTRIKLFGGPHPRIAASYADLGRTYARAGDPTRARANFQQALDMRLKLYPDGVHRTIVRTYRALAQTARDARDKQAAADYEARAREVKAKLGE